MNLTDVKGQPCRVMFSERDPKKRLLGKANIIVKQLSPTFDDKLLYESFAIFGRVISCKVVRGKDPSGFGYGYVRFDKEEDAELAIAQVNGILLGKSKVFVEKFIPKPYRPWTNVYVKRIPAGFGEERLVGLFQCKALEKEIERGHAKVLKEFNEKKAAKEAAGEDTSKMVAPKVRLPIEILSTKYWEHPFGTSACLKFAYPEQAYAAVKVMNNYLIETKDLPEKAADAAAGDDAAAASGDGGKESSSGADAAAAAGAGGGDKAKDEAGADGSAVKKEAEDDKEEAKADGADAAEDQDKEEEKKEEEDEEPTEVRLFVTRAMTRHERKMTLRRKRRDMMRNSAANLFVKNLPLSMTDGELHQLFVPFGNILSAKVAVKDGVSRGFGFVQFEQVANANKAMEKLNGHEIEAATGKTLYVAKFLSRDRRTSFRRRMRGGPERPQQPYVQGQFAPSMPSAWPGGTSAAAAAAAAAATAAAATGGLGAAGFPARFPVTAGAPFGAATAAGAFGRTLGAPYGAPMMFPPLTSAAGLPSLPRAPGFPVQPMTSQFLGSTQQGAVTSASVHSRTLPVGGSVGLGTGSVRHTAAASASAAAHPPSAPAHSTPATEGGGASSHIAGGVSSAMMREQAPPLTADMLGAAKPQERKRMIGERLFPKIQEVEPRLAGKITGMLLEMENTELLVLLTDPGQLMKKINEALAVLKEHQMRQSAKNSGRNLSAGQTATTTSAPHA